MKNFNLVCGFFEEFLLKSKNMKYTVKLILQVFYPSIAYAEKKIKLDYFVIKTLFSDEVKLND